MKYWDKKEYRHIQSIIEKNIFTICYHIPPKYYNLLLSYIRKFFKLLLNQLKYLQFAILGGNEYYPYEKNS